MTIVNFSEIAVSSAESQSLIINRLLKKNAFLSEMAVTASVGGMKHLFESVTNIVGGDVADMNAAGGTVSMQGKLNPIDLQFLKGGMTVSRDHLRYKGYGGNYSKYFGERAEPILNKTGQNVDNGLLYAFEDEAVTAGNYIKCGGSAANAQSSILIVRTETEGTSLLYNPLDGGAEIARWVPYFGQSYAGRILNAEGDEIAGYGTELEGAIGKQIASSDKIETLKNIDDSNVPTEAELLKGLRMARRDDTGTTKMFTSATVFDLLTLGVLKDKIVLGNNVNSLGYRLASYQGIDIIVDRNMVDTEAVVA